MYRLWFRLFVFLQLFGVVSGGVGVLSGAASPEGTLLTVNRIWDAAPHNAFTDLIRYKGNWYCAFREGDHHISDDGKLRVLRSRDGADWTSVALMEWTGGDIRDAKLSITGAGELMLNGAVRFHEPQNGNRHQSVTWLSDDGSSWKGPYADSSGLGTWRWSVSWEDGRGYSFGYSGKDEAGCLYRTEDGKTWEVHRDAVFPLQANYPNESSIYFTETGKALCLLRSRDNALFGTSRSPYTEWEWTELDKPIGGPKLIQLKNGLLLAVVRLYEPARTTLCRVDPEKGKLHEFLVLPSGGDTSYAGVVEHDGKVYISYYSSHEKKSSIYLAVVTIETQPITSKR